LKWFEGFAIMNTVLWMREMIVTSALKNLRNFEECRKNNEDIFENPLEKPQCFCYAKISGIYAAIFSFFEKSIPRKGMSLL